MQNVIKIYHVVQELLAFSLTANRLTKHTVNIVQTQELCNVCMSGKGSGETAYVLVGYQDPPHNQWKSDYQFDLLKVVPNSLLHTFASVM